MKLDKRWRTLARDEKRAWSAWAKDNPVLLDYGIVRRVSGHKAFTVILKNRAIAGEAAEPTVLPAPVTWLTGALSLRDTGPFTTNGGYMGFRVEQALVAPTKWFVWATVPVGAGELDPHRRLRFVNWQLLGPLVVDEVTPNFGDDYGIVNGTWEGPGEDGEWPVDTFIWMRVHQYANGQLGPGTMLKGRIQVEL